MERFPCLETTTFWAFIADNSPLGIHRGGYNGVASLIPKRSGNNLFVPTYAGLNYETIWLAGLPPYRHESGSKFEPRSEPMSIEAADERSAVLVQPETSHAHVSARITFRVEEPHSLHQRIELTLHRRFCPEGEPNVFRSLWASYIHMPPDRHIYLKVGSGPDLAGWFGITKADHSAPEMEIRPLPDGRELEAAEHLKAMAGQPARSEKDDPSLAEALSGPLAFYYGLCPDSHVFLMMFRQPERFRLAYSPCGGGKQPAWNPAWDYVLHLDDAQIQTPYVWDLCLTVKPFQGRADTLKDVRRYLQDG